MSTLFPTFGAAIIGGKMETIIIKIAELIQHGFDVIEDNRLKDGTKLQSLKLKLFALSGLIDELKAENLKLKQQIEIVKGEKK